MDHDKLTASNSIITALSPALDEHFIKIASVHHGLFYPENVERSLEELVYQNDSFLKFVANNRLSGQLRENQMLRLQELHNALEKETKKLLTRSLEKQYKPDPEEFKGLMILSDEFVSRINALGYDYAREDSGIDVVTGLRSKNALIDDLKRELSRTARRGGYFAIALCRIDRFDEIKSTISEQEIVRIYQSIASLFKSTMRLYDDGYLLDDGHFLLCLKHTDHSGSVAAVERIERILQEQVSDKNNSFFVSGTPISMSFIVASPEAEDDVAELIEILRNTLAKYSSESNLVLEHQEMSELERYIKDTQG